MQKLKNKLCELDLKIRMGLYNLMNNEDGDTNFISIAIILIIILAIALVFIGLRDTLMPLLEEQIEAVVDALGG